VGARRLHASIHTTPRTPVPPSHAPAAGHLFSCRRCPPLWQLRGWFSISRSLFTASDASHRTHTNVPDGTSKGHAIPLRSGCIFYFLFL